MTTTRYVVWQEIYSKTGEGFYCCLKKSWTRTDWNGPTQAASLHLVRLHLLKRMRKSASEERIKDVGNKNRWIVGKWKKNSGNTWMQKNPSGGAQLFMHMPPSLANWVQPWNSLLVTQVESEGFPFVLFGLFRRYQHESFHCHFFFCSFSLQSSGQQTLNYTSGSFHAFMGSLYLLWRQVPFAAINLRGIFTIWLIVSLEYPL